jgi:hypothetical protein
MLYHKSDSYVVAALQVRHHIAYKLEMGDYDLQ